MSSTIGSVTKACFAFKGKAKSTRQGNYFTDSKKQWLSDVGLETFEDQWDHIRTDTQILQAELNCKIFDDLLQFIDSHQKRFKAADGLSAHDAVLCEIPTAALITGVNMPDHETMFINLINTLKSGGISYMAVLKSKDCSTIKNLMTNVLNQFLETDNFEEGNNEVPSKVKKLDLLSMSVLESWYKEITSKQSPKKSPKNMADDTTVKLEEFCYPPLVIILEDLESFPDSVLQDFILTCGNYLKSLPIIFIVGIATSTTALHRLLPHQVSSLLSIEKFQAPLSSHYLSEVINKVLLTDHHLFKLNKKSFQFLLDSFLYYDFSVLNFIRGIQFAMLDHFYNNPLSILCCNVEEAEDRLAKMSHKQLESLKHSAPSFKIYVASMPDADQLSLLKDDAYFKKHLCELLSKLHSYHRDLIPALECLHVLVRNLPQQPLGKQLREIYMETLEVHIYDTPSYKECFTLLRTLSRDELGLLLTKCKDTLQKSSNSKSYVESVKDVENFIEKLVNFDVDAMTEEPDEKHSSEALPKRTDMHTLKKMLLESKKKKMSAYEIMRNDCIECLDTIFRKYLVCPKSFPFHEVFYYDKSSELRIHLAASPRIALQTALTTPHYYIQNDAVKSDDEGHISHLVPDLCIVYKLHLECGRLLNIYDWLQAFSTVINGDRKEDVDPNTQARFITAVSELQFLGFIKSTKRKTDHVSRLTWGGC